MTLNYFLATVGNFVLIITFSVLDDLHSEDKATHIFVFMCMSLFSMLAVATIIWGIKVVKPALFLIKNEAVLYHIHNPLNYNL